MATVTPTRNASGAFRMFYYMRSLQVDTATAHDIVRNGTYEVRQSYAPNPLCVETHKSLSAHYSRRGAYTGD